MRLTERDLEIIRYCDIGSTIQQTADMFFNGSYFTAAQRLIKLESAKYIRSTLHPTIGKKVYFTKKKPSFHTLVVNDIKIALQGKYGFIDTEYMLGKTRVDCVVLLRSKKIVIFEINIFKHTTQKRIDYLNKLLAENRKQGDIWVLEIEHRRRHYEGARVIDIKGIRCLNTIYT